MRFSFCSDPGRVRPENQDAYAVEILNRDDGLALLAVADGMGGHAGGDIASRMALQVLVDQVKSQSHAWGEAAAIQDGLRQGAQAAHTALQEAQRQNPHLAGMGTTLTAALITGDRITLVHTGDSRCYRLRQGQAEQLTADHSVVGEMVRQGVISEAEAMHHPHRNLLISALGSQAELRVDLLETDWQPGDVLLLCTDGLTNLVTAAELAAWADDWDRLASLPTRLVVLANERGGHDNITVVSAWRER